MKRNRISEATGSGSAGHFKVPIVLAPQDWKADQLAPFNTPVYDYINAELAYEEADDDFKETPEQRKKIEDRTEKLSKLDTYLKSFYTDQNDDEGSSISDIQSPDKLIQQAVGPLKEDLAVWFGKKKAPKGSHQPKGPWVNICRKKEGGGHPPCGRPEASDKGYPKCRAAGVASKMTDSQKRSACQQKRNAEKTHNKSGTGNSPKMVSYKPKNESMKKTIRLTESEIVNIIRKIINEQKGVKIGTLYCYSDLNQIANPSARPQVEIGPSIVNNVYEEETGLWSVTLDLENPPSISDSPVGEPETTFEIDIVPASRLMSALRKEEIPLKDSKDKILVHYSQNKRHYCRAKNPEDEQTIKSYSKS